MNVKKVFISVGMRGRSDSAVRQDIARITSIIRDMYKENCIVKIYHNYDCEWDGPFCSDPGRLYYLGEAIKKLGECDVCYFTKDWQNHKGCRAEMEICRIYGIDIIEEL